MNLSETKHGWTKLSNDGGSREIRVAVRRRYEVYPGQARVLLPTGVVRCVFHRTKFLNDE